MISRPRDVLELIRATQPQARIIYDLEAIHFRRYQRMIPLAPIDQTRALIRAAREMVQTEVGLIADADAVLCVSEDDRSFARSIAPSTPVVVVSHACDAPGSVAPFDERRNMIFFGAFWNPGSPNEDAVLHLVHHVMPVIWKEDPSIHLIIIGADPTAAVLRLEGSRVSVLGYVSDPSHALSRARVHIAPIRAGAGIKLRFIDSMAAGLPFVTTTVGAEGLPLRNLESVVVADAPVEIAHRALALYRDCDLWTNVQHALRDIAAGYYSGPALREQLTDALVAVGIAPPAAHTATECASRSSGASGSAPSPPTRSLHQGSR